MKKYVAEYWRVGTETQRISSIVIDANTPIGAKRKATRYYTDGTDAWSGWKIELHPSKPKMTCWTRLRCYLRITLHEHLDF